MGEVRKLRSFNAESGGITIPKEKLAEAGCVDRDGEIVEDAYVNIEEEEPGKWSVEVLDV